MLFSVCLVLLTPLFLCLAAVLLVGGILYADLPIFDHSAFYVSVLFGGNIFLALLFLSLFFRPKQDWQRSGDDKSNIMKAGACYAVLLFVTHSSAAPSSKALLTLIWFALAMAVLAFLGKAYAARDDYYMGVYNGMIDDPFTFKDDWDRAHFTLGMVSLVPEALLHAYSEVFAGWWLWKPLTDEELDAVTDVMANAWSNKPQQLGDVPKIRAEKVLRLLAELKWVRPHKEGAELSLAGRDIVKNGLS